MQPNLQNSNIFGNSAILCPIYISEVCNIKCLIQIYELHGNLWFMELELRSFAKNNIAIIIVEFFQNVKTNQIKLL